MQQPAAIPPPHVAAAAPQQEQAPGVSELEQLLSSTTLEPPGEPRPRAVKVLCSSGGTFSLTSAASGCQYQGTGLPWLGGS